MKTARTTIPPVERPRSSQNKLVERRVPRRSGWTEERRAAAAAAIKKWEPWKRSTGPTTPEGKARSAQNLRPSAARRSEWLFRRHARQEQSRIRRAQWESGLVKRAAARNRLQVAGTAHENRSLPARRRDPGLPPETVRAVHDRLPEILSLWNVGATFQEVAQSLGFPINGEQLRRLLLSSPRHVAQLAEGTAFRALLISDAANDLGSQAAKRELWGVACSSTLAAAEIILAEHPEMSLCKF